jgi:predicted DNA-binding transcriptional regulator AlpA
MQRSLSAGQISEYLEISIDTVSSRIRAGNFPLPDVIIGNHYQGWAPETIDEWHSCERGVARLRATQHNGEPQLAWSAASRSISGFGNKSSLCI